MSHQNAPIGAKPLLSICIPTYNRQDLIVPLVRRLLAAAGEFEVRVHDDGSRDETVKRLETIGDHRLHVTSASNRGRARALQTAISDACGRFTMVFDDDDVLSAPGLRQVLSDCSSVTPEGVVGYVYHLVDEGGDRIGSDFPVERANHLSLHLDWKVRGDKKQVVKTDLLQRAVALADRNSRRVPTSFYWSALAFDGDLICRNIDIGRKTYRVGGMSHRNTRLRLQNPKPMVDLYSLHLRGFFRRRYRSAAMAGRALIGAAWYSCVHFATSMFAQPHR